MASFFQRLRALWRKPRPVPPGPLQTFTPRVTAPSPAQVEHPPDPDRPLAEDLVYEALRKCNDPEIPVNIVDLGLIYDVRINEGRVDVKMTLTTQGCGMGGYIANEAEEQLRALPGVHEAKVEVVWDPPWHPSMISPAGRQRLGLPEEG
jgi:metal-sulfur cluster biosynthetic enzyme